MKKGLLCLSVLSSFITSQANDMQTNFVNENTAIIEQIDEYSDVILYKLLDDNKIELNNDEYEAKLLSYVHNNTCDDSIEYLKTEGAFSNDSFNANYLLYNLLITNCKKSNVYHENPISYLIKSAEAGHIESIERYHDIVGNPLPEQKYDYWFNLLDKAANAGNEKAIFELARFYSAHLENEYFLLYIEKIIKSDNNKGAINYLYGMHFYNLYNLSQWEDHKETALKYFEISYNSSFEGLDEIYDIFDKSKNYQDAFKYISKLNSTEEQKTKLKMLKKILGNKIIETEQKKDIVKDFEENTSFF